MALERIGLGGLLTLDNKQFVQASGAARNELGQFIRTANQAPAAMNKMAASMTQAAQKMKSGAQQIGQGVKQLGAGLRNAALGFAPLTLAVGAGIKQAADFEKQMSAVAAITRGTEAQMASLTDTATEMGIKSVFSATQSAEAMEAMGRAGATTDQIITGLSGVMNAAAADSISLATSANIVSQVVKGMGLEFEDANRIANNLALASASTNTDIIGLGEAFKFGGAVAKAAGIKLEETTAIFGSLANAGLKGSLAGTSFSAMMTKLTKPTGKASKIMKKFKINLSNADGSFRKISDITSEFAKELDKIPTKAEQLAIAQEVFGKRGARAFQALALAGKKNMDDLEDSLLASSFGIGAAAEAAEKRLDNFTGALTLFKSSVESVSIGLFTPLLKEFTPVIQEMTDGLNAVLFSLKGLQKVRNAENAENSASAVLIGKTAKQRLLDAGATKQQALATSGAVQVLTRMALGEEKLSRATVEARKRGIRASFETAQAAQKTEALVVAARAAGVKKIEDLSDKRKAAVLKGLESSQKDELAFANKQIEIAFSGTKGAEAAQRRLKTEVLRQATLTNKGLSAKQATRLANQLSFDASLEAAQAVQADSLRAQIFKIEELQRIEDEHGSAAVQIALGIQDAIDTLTNAWNATVEAVKRVGAELEARLGSDTIRKIVKFATVFAVIAAAAVPLVLAMVTFGFAVSGLTTAFLALKVIAAGVMTFLGGAIGFIVPLILPVLAVLGLVALAFSAIRNEGESIQDTLTRVWNVIKAGAVRAWQGILSVWRFMVSIVMANMGTIKEVWNNTVGVMAEIWVLTINLIRRAATNAWNIITQVFGGVVTAISQNLGIIKNTFTQVFRVVADVWNETVGFMRAEFQGMFDHFNTGGSELAVNWIEVGTTIGNFISAMIIAIVQVIGFLVTTALKLFKVLWTILKAPFVAFDRLTKRVFDGVLDIMEGRFLTGVAKVGLSIFDFLIKPFRLLLEGILALISKIPGASKFIPKGLQKFAEEGLSGIVFPKPPQAKKAVKIVEEGAASAAKLRGQGAGFNSLSKSLDAARIATAKDRGKETGGLASLTQSLKDSTGLDGQPEISQDPIETRADKLASLKDQLSGITDLKAQEKARAAEAPSVTTKIDLTDKRKIDINNQLCVDNEEMSIARERHKQEVQDRAGFKATPWQRRIAVESGAAPVSKAG